MFGRMNGEDVLCQVSSRREWALFLGLAEYRDSVGENSNLDRTQMDLLFIRSEVEAAEHFVWMNLDFVANL
jgi:hypothetical protein